jgi:glycosyltransferase involved in cell wall biosynthesis
MARKIKILECIRQGQIGGGESHLLSLVENLDRTRFEPAVLSFTEGPMIDRLHLLGVETYVIHTEKPFDFRVWSEVKALLKKLQIEMIHAHGTRAASNILWAARSLNIPVVYTIHGWSFHPDQHPLIRAIRIRSEKYLTSRSAVNISVSASNQQSGRQYIRDFDSIVINNGIDRNKFAPGKVVKNIRESLGIPGDRILVLFLARFTNHKQPLTLIKAFREAVAAVPALYLLMVGDGDQKKEAVEWVEHTGMQENIGFQPFRQDVPDVLAAADIFVLPSLWEGLPIGLLEAMAMGKAIIATEVDGTREIVEHERNGLLIQPGDVSALTAALIRLAKDEALRTAFQQKTIETVRERFDAEEMTRKIEQVYEELPGIAKGHVVQNRIKIAPTV